MSEPVAPRMIVLTEDECLSGIQCLNDLFRGDASVQVLMPVIRGGLHGLLGALRSAYKALPVKEILPKEAAEGPLQMFRGAANEGLPKEGGVSFPDGEGNTELEGKTAGREDRGTSVGKEQPTEGSPKKGARKTRTSPKGK